ncbi:hypothetical protein LCGC14_0965800, partial [marine sediment metagenome]
MKTTDELRAQLATTSSPTTKKVILTQISRAKLTEEEESLRHQIRKCRRCGLNRTRSHAVPFSGPTRGRADLMIVGEAPGASEDSKGIPFVGASGKLLDLALSQAGTKRDQCFVANTLCCVEGSAIVSSPSSIHKGFRRWYVGPLVTIETMNGIRLSVTPNHPVLTDGGWVSASEVKHGFNLVSKGDGQLRMISPNPDPQHPPSSFKELFSLLSSLGVSQRAVGGVMDFHGDGHNTDVDVVRTNGLLKGGLKIANHSGYSQLKCSCENPIGFQSRSPFGHPSDSFLRTNSSLGSMTGFKSLVNPLFLSHVGPSYIESFSEGTSPDSFAVEKSIDRGFGNIPDLSNLSSAFPFAIKLDKVISINRRQ